MKYNLNDRMYEYCKECPLLLTRTDNPNFLYYICQANKTTTIYNMDKHYCIKHYLKYIPDNCVNKYYEEIKVYIDLKNL